MTSEPSEDDLAQALDRHVAGLDVGGLADVLWSYGRTGEMPDLELIWAELVGILQSIRESLPLAGARDVPLAFASPIAEMSASLLAKARVAPAVDADRLMLLGWRLNEAWTAVLAGDIDVISEHVESEERALG